MNRSIVRFALAAIALGSLSVFAQAQVIVSPNSVATTEGDARANTAPFNNINRFQQIYDASEFASLGGPALITQIAFRPDASQATPFSRTFPGFQVNLSTTTQTVSGLSATFADNVGANDTVVQSGALTLTTANLPGSGTAKEFDLILNLTTPFLYDPGAGNLLLDIRNFSSGFAGFVDGAVDTTANPKIRINFVDNTTTDPAGTVQPAGLVTRFTLQSAASVPEPGTLALVAGMGVPGLLALRRRR